MRHFGTDFTDNRVREKLSVKSVVSLFCDNFEITIQKIKTFWKEI